MEDNHLHEMLHELQDEIIKMGTTLARLERKIEILDEELIG